MLKQIIEMGQAGKKKNVPLLGITSEQTSWVFWVIRYLHSAAEDGELQQDLGKKQGWGIVCI